MTSLVIKAQGLPKRLGFIQALDGLDLWPNPGRSPPARTEQGREHNLHQARWPRCWHPTTGELRASTWPLIPAGSARSSAWPVGAPRSSRR